MAKNFITIMLPEAAEIVKLTAERYFSKFRFEYVEDQTEDFRSVRLYVISRQHKISAAKIREISFFFSAANEMYFACQKAQAAK